MEPKYSAIVACVSVLANGCASYKGQPLSPATSLRFGTIMNQVTMRAEPLSAAQVKAVFDADPEEIRILFVRTIMQNEGEVQYLITRTGIRLLTKQGLALTPVSPSRVAKKMRATHDGLAIGSVFLFGVLSYPSFQSANEANDAMVKDLMYKAFPEQIALMPHTTVGGMLHFELPSYVTSHDGVRMDAVLRPGAGGEPLLIQVPFSGGTKEEK